MNKIKKILLILASIILFYACAEHCDSIPKEYKDFFPYENEDILSFVNTKGELVTFEITQKSINDDYKIAWNCKCACLCYLSYSAIQKNNNTNMYIYSEMLNPSSKKDFSFSYTIVNLNCISEYHSNCTAPFPDTIIFSPTVYSDIKGTIKLVKGVGLVNLFIGEEEYTLKKEE